MKGDFTRDTFKHYKHFSRVLSQQGRVQLDADWNEQTAILLHFLRNLAADLIGQHGGPENDYGFRIGPIGGVANDFGIGPGRYYVDGVLCEIEPSEAVSITVNGDEVTIPSATNVKFTKSEYVEIFDDASGVTE